MIKTVQVPSVPRIVLAKPGLDGHDRGIKVVAMTLRDAGMEVIYLGLRQSVEGILLAAEQENADAVGISVLSGVHMAITSKLLIRRAELKMESIPVFVGGTISRADASELRRLGAADVFPVGTHLEDLARRVKIVISDRELALP
ncbi:unannotated protein [freshwater metagenome]|uniref:Unannotated protein n=1 Tax=freshwater metagenome TaxID=449393 RepID=A0A6J6SUV3_9ZZZZ